MTGKEHRLPRAVFFAFKHMPITFFFFRKGKQKLLVWFVGLLSYWNVKVRQSHRIVLHGGISIRLFLRFKCFLVGMIRRKFTLFKSVKVRVTEIWSLLELFKDWLLEREEWDYSTRSTVKCFNCADKQHKKKKKSHKCMWLKQWKVKITESLPTPDGCLLSRLCTSLQSFW